MDPQRRDVFVTGGTGYLGAALIPRLLERGHRVRALVRDASATRLAAGCEPIVGDALRAASFVSRAAPADTLVHLVGVSHPAPWKAGLFETVDAASVRASLEAVGRAGVTHLVYLSVAHPAPVMSAYWQSRERCEALIRAAGVDATFLRPWYVLGPGHRWPYLLLPVYALAARWPGRRETAARLGLVRRAEMIAALVWAVENPATGVRVLDVAAIRARASARAT